MAWVAEKAFSKMSRIFVKFRPIQTLFWLGHRTRALDVYAAQGITVGTGISGRRKLTWQKPDAL